MEIDGASKILQSTEDKKMQEARVSALNKVLKLNLILNEIDNLKLGPEYPEIERARKLISVADYIRLGDKQEHLLGLQDCSSVPPLSYMDRKIVREKLVANLRATLPPIAELGDKIRRELPDALRKEDEVQLSTQQQEIIRLQQEQRDCMEKLSDIRNQKCELMMEAVELKMGPQLSNELKVQQAQAQLQQTKAELLRIYLIDQVFSQTENSLKAHEEVDKYINELMQSSIKPKRESERE